MHFPHTHFPAPTDPRNPAAAKNPPLILSVLGLVLFFGIFGYIFWPIPTDNVPLAKSVARRAPRMHEHARMAQTK